MKKGVSKIEVFDFKENWCNENKLIAMLIKQKINNYFIPPILDVGSGLGDIAYNSFPDKEAICIDVNEVTEEESPVSKKHTRLTADFFHYSPNKQIQTVFISHTLQFIDDNIDRLNKKIASLNPKHVILVMNSNKDVMGEIIRWTRKNFKNSNPEVHIPRFPKGYTLIKKIQFKADINCPDFKRLTKQISYLMLVDLDSKMDLLENFLKAKLHGKPKFSFNQAIEIYKKNEK